MSEPHGLQGFQGYHALCNPGAGRSGRFGRMFPGLAPLYSPPAALRAIGDANGPMKSTGSAQKTTSVAVGQVFFGQFVDHDITLDLTSSFARTDRPEATDNARTPTLDLDCIYGDGPEGSPFLYHNVSGSLEDRKFNGVKLLTGADLPGATAEQQQDLARSGHDTAIIGDPRNDENRIISQLQLGVIRFHNKVADAMAAKGLRREDLFHETRRVVTWHYQWAVVNDFLRAMVGQPLISDILGRGRQVYRPEAHPFGDAEGSDAFMPVEFSVAAYRFGHTMVPQRIQVQPGGSAFEVFGPSLGRGFSPLPGLSARVSWPQLLDLSDATVDRADRLDAKLAKDLLQLEFVETGERSLATRNLLRGQAFRLPSGEAVAARCGRPQTEIDQVTAAADSLASSAGTNLAGGTPLWLYGLLEGAEIGRETSPGNFDQGEGLGPVAGRIVAETLIGLMELDPDAYLGSNRQWSPDGEDKLQPSGVHNLLELLTF